MTGSGSSSVYRYTNIKITSSLPYQHFSSESDVLVLQVLWGLWHYLQSAVHCLWHYLQSAVHCLWHYLQSAVHCFHLGNEDFVISHAYGAGSHLLTHGIKISPSDLLSVGRIILA